MPKISVIIPIYNTEEYIYECLESLRKQTFTDFEAIIVNDGSTDGSLNIIQNFITMDARFQCITIVNSGQLLARKTGIELSKGEYITFLDGDDFVSKEWLDTLLVNIEREKSDISIIGYNLYFDNGNKYIRMSNPKLFFTSVGDEILEEWISAKHFEGFLNDKMFKKNLFSHIIWPKNIRYLEDIALLNQIIVKVKKITYCGYNLYQYRQRENSIVHSTFNSAEFKSLVYIENMIVMSKGNYYLENLAYSRYAKIALSIFGQMDRYSIKEHNEIIADVLDKIHHMKSIGKIQMRNSIEEIILTGMLVTKRVYILSRIENQLIKIKHYMKKR